MSASPASMTATVAAWKASVSPVNALSVMSTTTPAVRPMRPSVSTTVVGLNVLSVAAMAIATTQRYRSVATARVVPVIPYKTSVVRPKRPIVRRQRTAPSVWFAEVTKIVIKQDRVSAWTPNVRPVTLLIMPDVVTRRRLSAG